MSYTHFIKTTAESMQALDEQNFSILKPKKTIRDGDELIFDSEIGQIKTKVETAIEHPGLKQGYQFVHHVKI